MNINTLKAVSSLDGRYSSNLDNLSDFVSEYALIYLRIEIEVKYLFALSNIGVIRKLKIKEQKLLKDLYEIKSEEEATQVKEIEDKIKHDVKAVEIYIREKLKNTSLKDVIEYIHFALTSEDVNNIAYRLVLKRGFEFVVYPKFVSLLESIVNFAFENSDLTMMARTHGQSAIPTTLGKEIGVFASRLDRQYRKWEKISFTGKLNGAIGGWNAHNLSYPKFNWIKFSKSFVESFGLEYIMLTTQINQYDDVVEFLQSLHRVNSILLDFNQDMWRYISDGWLSQKVNKNEVGSSTMAQKINPINFENSEGNIQVANSLIEGLSRSLMVSRLQRDLSGSTVIRNLGVILGHELLITSGSLRGISKVHTNKEVITDYLTQNYSILAESTQIILRKHLVKDAYEVIKQKTMGEDMSKEKWEKMINDLDVSEKIKKEILEVTPFNYTGYCLKITKASLLKIKKYFNY